MLKGMHMRIHRRGVTAFVVAAFAATVVSVSMPAPAYGQQQQSGPPAKKSVLSWSRPDQSCPPLGLSQLYQWDDGKGNDLALEIMCVAGNPGYFSMRLSQSLNGHYTTVASPTGTSGQTRTDDC